MFIPYENKKEAVEYDATTLSIKTHSITIFSIMTRGIKFYFETLGTNDTQHNNNLPFC